MRQQLRIIVEHFDDLEPDIDVRERRNTAHALAEILRTRRRFQQRIVVALRKEVIEGIDVAHVYSLCQCRRVGKIVRSSIRRGHSASTILPTRRCLTARFCLPYECDCVSHDAMANASASRSK